MLEVNKSCQDLASLENHANSGPNSAIPSLFKKQVGFLLIFLKSFICTSYIYGRMKGRSSPQVLLRFYISNDD